jgi:uncharacterized metal-binding protein YceD (DUF177 family)
MENMQIALEQLQDGQTVAVEESLPPSFLHLEETDVVFNRPIYLKGEVSRAGDHLILRVKAQTEVLMPCSFCNEMTLVPLCTQEICGESEERVFDYSGLVREEIILMVPQFAECTGGHCPNRSLLDKLRKKKTASTPHHTPFSELF